jgi:hypothetical protein
MDLLNHRDVCGVCDGRDCAPINGLIGRYDCCARARIVTAQQDSIQDAANTEAVAPDGCSSSPAAGLTCRYRCLLRPVWGVVFSVMLRAASRARRRTGTGGRVAWVELLALCKNCPQNAGVLVGDGDECLLVADARLQLDNPA